MYKFFKISTLTMLALGATALTAQAQEKATELSVGMIGVSTTHYDYGFSNSRVAFATGGGYLAAGFYLSPGMAIEPSLTFLLVSQSFEGEDTETASSIGFAVALPYYFNKGWGRKGPYLAPRLGYVSIDGGSSESAVGQFELGLALGTKVPLNDMAALRLQASFDYGFENADLYSSTQFGASAGLSVFLK